MKITKTMGKKYEIKECFLFYLLEPKYFDRKEKKTHISESVKHYHGHQHKKEGLH